VGDLVWGLAHLESDGLSCDSTVGLRSADVEQTGTSRANAPLGLCPRGRSAIGRRPTARLVQLSLVDELPVHGSEDPAFPCAKARIGLGGLGHTHRCWRGPIVVWHLAQYLREGVRLHPQDTLKRSNAFRPWSGLPQKPLRHRRLGYPQRVGQRALGQTTLLARPLERLSESPSLLGRCHVATSASMPPVVTSMPDHLTTDRLSAVSRRKL
jgi:hypothetical protein